MPALSMKELTDVRNLLKQPVITKEDVQEMIDKAVKKVMAGTPKQEVKPAPKSKG